MNSKQRRLVRRAVQETLKDLQSNKADTLSVHSTPATAKNEKRRMSFEGKIGILITILLGIPTLLGLKAHPTVSLGDPLDSNNVGSTPFIISDDGLLDLKNVDVTSYVVRLERSNQDIELENLSAAYLLRTPTLIVGEKETVPFSNIVGSPLPILKADIALIVTFSPQYMPFWRKESAFRFETVREASGRLRLVEEPSGDILEMYERRKTALRRAFPSLHWDAR